MHICHWQVTQKYKLKTQALYIKDDFPFTQSR